MKCILIFATLALVAALATEENSASDEAKSTVAQLLQSGKSASACKDLAEATIKEVEDSVKTAQKILATTDDGSKCKDEGKNLVDAATATVNTASKSADDTKKAADAACSANVQLKPQSFSSLKAKECSFVTKDPAFVQAKKTCNDNTKSADTAKGALQGANSALADAKKTAKSQAKDCRCATQAAHKVATEAANKGNSAENKKAWDKAHNMLCVLAGTASCKVPTLPTVTPPKIDTAAANEKCPAPKKACKLSDHCCTFKIYNHNNYKDAKGSYKHCSTDGSSKYFGLNNEQKKVISSFKLSGDCKKVKVYDDDLELLQGAQDKYYTGNAKSLPNDLNDDIRAVKIYPNGC